MFVIQITVTHNSTLFELKLVGGIDIYRHPLCCVTCVIILLLLCSPTASTTMLCTACYC